MPKIAKSNGVTRTRLLPSDRGRLLQLARQRSISEAAMARYGLIWFLDNYTQGERNRMESVYAQELRSSVTRMCGFLSRMAADLQALYWFVSDQNPEGISGLRLLAVGHIFNELAAEDQRLANLMSQTVPSDANSEHNQA